MKRIKFAGEELSTKEYVDTNIEAVETSKPGEVIDIAGTEVILNNLDAGIYQITDSVGNGKLCFKNTQSYYTLTTNETIIVIISAYSSSFKNFIIFKRKSARDVSVTMYDTLSNKTSYILPV